MIFFSRPARAHHPRDRGFTLIELLVVITIIGILTAAVLPISRVTITRTRELELKRALRTMRRAIDQYKLNYDKHVYKEEEQVDRSGYPLTLDELLEKKLLRSIPIDPLSGQKEWRTVSFTDDLDSQISDGADVYDVHSLSEEVALDGTSYSEW